MKKLIFLYLLFPFIGLAQDDLLNEIDSVPQNQKVESAFKSLKIVNLESTKLAAKGDFYFVVAHRFGFVNNGFDDFFGLDNANTQLKFLYGVNELLTIHASRSGFQETYDVAAKYRLFAQGENNFPFTIVGFNSIAINSELKEENYPNLKIFKNGNIQITGVKNKDDVNIITNPNTQFVIYNIEYIRKNTGPEMTVYLAEV